MELFDTGSEDEESSRRFWIGFATGWLVYFGILVSFGTAEDPGRFGRTVLTALVNTVPIAAVGTLVAYHRHRLLRGDWNVLKTLGLHVVIGLAFAATAALLATLLSSAAGLPTELADEGPWLSFVYRMISTTFLYIVLLGCLMWSESMRRMRAGERAVAQAAVLRAEAEARAIRAQFNPHFVFNTLHSLMLLVRADPGRAERAIEDVATLIRYASILQRRDIDAVPLAKELEVARRYVALESLRLQERLEIQWTVEVDPASATVPAFALQTLVENAIKHGIEPEPAGGRVHVEVLGEGGVLTLRVSDDGRGAAVASVDATPGHGLALLRRRLAGRYGEDGRLTWTTAPGEGFTATVTLPLERPARVAELDVIQTRAPAVSGT